MQSSVYRFITAKNEQMKGHKIQTLMIIVIFEEEKVLKFQCPIWLPKFKLKSNKTPNSRPSMIA